MALVLLSHQRTSLHAPDPRAERVQENIMNEHGSLTRHFDRFNARAALALVAAALVFFAHSVYHLQILRTLGLAALLAWAALEIRHTYRRRHPSAESGRR
jgi:hypothetical protein